MSSDSNCTSTAPQALRIFVFDSPRTCSHLFRKLFLSHPQLGHILEPFLVPSVFSNEGVTDLLLCSAAAWDVVVQARTAVPELTKCTYNVANTALKENLEAVEQKGKIPWIKDHALYSVKPEIILSALRSDISDIDILERYSNPTLINDALLHSFTPTFLIRHPVLVVRSYWEVNLQSIGSNVDDEQFAWMSSVRWVRLLFDFYRKHCHDIPLVVDAEDVVHRTSELADQICDRLGIAQSGVVFEWEPETMTDKPGEFFKTRIRSSKGVERDDEGGTQNQIDTNAAYAEWSTKYGPTIGSALRRRVEAELPHYEYLHQFRLLS